MPSNILPSDEDFLRQLLATFKVELDERLETLNRCLLQLEAGTGEPQDLVDQIFREAHSLKGAARAVEVKEVEEVAHAMEALLSEVKQGRAMDPNMFTILYGCVDFFTKAMEARLAGNTIGQEEVRSHVLDLENARVGFGALKPPSGPTPEAPSPDSQQLPAHSKEKKTRPRGHRRDRTEDAQPEAPQPPPAAIKTEVPPAEPPARPVAVAARADLRAAEAEAAPRLGANRRTGEEDRRRRDRRLDDALLAKETIRVSTAKLDTLLATSGELLITKIKVAQHQETLTGLSTGIASLEKQLAELRKILKPHGDGGGPGARLAEACQERIRSLSRSVKRFRKEFHMDTARLHTLSREIQEEIKRIRMLPVGLLFDNFYRMVRDLSQVKGKQVVMTTEGGDCALDKKLIEALKDPLMHLIRNAIDHGIEAPQTRADQGKSPQGHIHLSARQKGDTIIISVEDDGMGINTEAVKQKAIKRGMLRAEDSETLSQRDILNFIFRPGFSTSPIVDDISGRGIGLDVVHTTVERLNGTLDVSSVPGQGARFIMQLPLTVSTFQGLLVKAGGQVFIFPIASVDQIRRIPPKEIRRLGSSETVQLGGLPVQLGRLAGVLGLQEAPRDPDEKLVVVVLGSAEKRVGFVVDELMGEQEVILKSFSRPLIRVRYLAGATILGNGMIVMILNVAELVNASSQPHPTAPPVPTRKPVDRPMRSILVVDDSITTRTLEKNILETAGYRVLLATDGVEAFGTLQTEEVDLVLSDVQMPRLDGFSLTRKIKSDPRHKDMPVILVTSFASPEDKARGIEAGADAYIAKSSFDQNKLLQTIEHLTD
ncbi:MAG: hybrid sensor histidine kinase/response regulator [Acidobacteriota bacterium]